MSTLVLRIEPSVTAKYFHLLPENRTIEELLAMLRDVPANVWTHGRAAIGGTEIPRDWWSRVRIKSGTALSLTINPHGGGGDSGGKDIISSLALLAVVAAASFVSAGALAPFLGAAFAPAAFGAQAAALGITVVGQLAISALAPPPIAPSLDNTSQQVSEIAGVTGNPLSRREYVPRVLGKMRVSPPHVMFPFTELVDGDVVANALVGLAGQHKIEDIQISGAPIDEFDGITHQCETGAASDGQVSLFDFKSAVEQNVGEALSEFQLQTGTGDEEKLVDQTNPENSYPKWKTFKTRGSADRVDIRLFWPSGITFQSTARGMQPTVFQFRLVGSDTWLSGPELWWSDKNSKNTQKRQHIRLIWDEVPLGLTNNNTDTFALVAYGDTPETFQWKPETYFKPGANYFSEAVDITDDGYEIYLDPATYPKGEYEIRVKRGLQIGYSGFTQSTYVWSAGTARWYDSISTVAPWEATNNQDDQVGPVVLETFLTRSDDYPLTQTGLTLIAIRAVGVQVNQISALFTSIVPGRDEYVWHFDDDVEGWTATRQTIAQFGSAITIAGTATDPFLRSPDALGIDGSVFDTIRFRLKEIVAATNWEGRIYYSTSGHGESVSFYKSFTEPTFDADGWANVIVDMSSLTVGGSDWIDNEITQIRIDLDDALNGEYEIDWIATGVDAISDWVDVATNSPAAIYRHVLSSSLNSRALPEAIIDDVELSDWHDRALNSGYECNFITQNYSVDQCKQIVAAAGWAVPQQSEKWAVIQERDLSADAPSQLFSQRNTRGMIVEKAFNNLPHAIVAEFFDVENNYLQAEEVVYFPGYSALNATLFESITYEGITRRTKARERAQLDIDQLIYRQSRYVLETDMSHLVTPRGGLVAVSNDFLSKIYDSAFIKSVTTSTGNITALEIDGTVKIEAYEIDVFSESNIFSPTDVFGETSASAVTIQENDGSTLTLDIDETVDTSTLTLTTPLADPGTIEAGLLVAVGRPGRVVKRCRIFNIERVSDFNARITLLDEAPEIYQ